MLYDSNVSIFVLSSVFKRYAPQNHHCGEAITIPYSIFQRSRSCSINMSNNFNSRPIVSKEHNCSNKSGEPFSINCSKKDSPNSTKRSTLKPSCTSCKFRFCPSWQSLKDFKAKCKHVNMVPEGSI